MTPYTRYTTTLLFPAALLFAAGCVAEVPDEDVSMSQGELRCTADCCGELNCRVPDPGKRRGCGGARIRNGATGDCMWPLRAGADRSIYDGMGTRMGEVRSDAVKLNQGIRKQRDGRWYVYAFTTTVRLVDGTLRPFSGWIRQSDLVHADRLHGYTLALDDPGNGHYETRWRITGGDVARFSRLHLVSPGGRRYPATDYLLRPYGLVHLTYTVPGFNLGGHATDSFQPGAIFRRARGVLQIVIPLYGPRGHRSRYSLHFVYGYVHDGAQRRYGWIAKEALEPVGASSGSDSGGGTGSGSGGDTGGSGGSEGSACAARCCDGTVILEIAASSAGECVSLSSPVCRDHEYVERARFEGSVVYERDRFCWAKCSNRSAYHRVDGVVSGCTDQARTFCRVGDRGAFEDAIWDSCQPL
jgi:hypothetical protein